MVNTTRDQRCKACGGTGTAGGHRCTSYDCCGPCEKCDGTGVADLDVCADCGGSTAIGTPDPHVCAPHCDGCDQTVAAVKACTITHHDGTTSEARYCDDCIDLARVDWNGETAAIEVES